MVNPQCFCVRLDGVGVMEKGDKLGVINGGKFRKGCLFRFLSVPLP